MDIIYFFRSIDGVLYYVLLVVNTILIFAIIGYLGEKNNQKLIKMGLDTPVPNERGAMDFSMNVATKHNDIAMPTVAPTTIQNAVTPNSNVTLPNQVFNNNLVTPNQTNDNNLVVPNQINNQALNGNQIASPTVTQPQVNNAIDSNSNSPAVLVINGQNNNVSK